MSHKIFKVSGWHPKKTFVWHFTYNLEANWELFNNCTTKMSVLLASSSNMCFCHCCSVLIVQCIMQLFRKGKDFHDESLWRSLKSLHVRWHLHIYETPVKSFNKCERVSRQTWIPPQGSRDWVLLQNELSLQFIRSRLQQMYSPTVAAPLSYLKPWSALVIKVRGTGESFGLKS